MEMGWCVCVCVWQKGITHRVAFFQGSRCVFICLGVGDEGACSLLVHSDIIILLCTCQLL